MADTIGSPSRSAATAAAGGRRGGGGGGGRVILSADGVVFMSTGGTPRISTDRGATWKDVTGLPSGLSPIADRSNPAKFYALDMAQHLMYLSTDGGATFAMTYEVTGLPAAGGGGGVGRGGRGGGGPGDWSQSGAVREIYGSLDGRFTIRAMAASPSRKSPTIRRLVS